MLGIIYLILAQVGEYQYAISTINQTYLKKKLGKTALVPRDQAIDKFVFFCSFIYFSIQVLSRKTQFPSVQNNFSRKISYEIIFSARAFGTAFPRSFVINRSVPKRQTKEATVCEVAGLNSLNNCKTVFSRSTIVTYYLLCYRRLRIPTRNTY